VSGHVSRRRTQHRAKKNFLRPLILPKRVVFVPGVPLSSKQTYTDTNLSNIQLFTAIILTQQLTTPKPKRVIEVQPFWNTRNSKQSLTHRPTGDTHTCIKYSLAVLRKTSLPCSLLMISTAFPCAHRIFHFRMNAIPQIVPDCILSNSTF
jgi:hypothetical protein